MTKYKYITADLNLIVGLQPTFERRKRLSKEIQEEKKIKEKIKDGCVCTNVDQ
jgi:hypothetical protein